MGYSRELQKCCTHFCDFYIVLSSSKTALHLSFIALLCDLGSELLCLHINQESPLRIMFIVAVGKLRTPINMSRTL